MLIFIMLALETIVFISFDVSFFIGIVFLDLFQQTLNEQEENGKSWYIIPNGHFDNDIVQQLQSAFFL